MEAILHARLERKEDPSLDITIAFTSLRIIDRSIAWMGIADGSVGSMKFSRKRSLREGVEKSLMQGIICRPAVRFPLKAAGLRPDTLRTDQIY